MTLLCVIHLEERKSLWNPFGRHGIFQNTMKTPKRVMAYDRKGYKVDDESYSGPQDAGATQFSRSNVFVSENATRLNIS